MKAIPDGDLSWNAITEIIVDISLSCQKQ